MRVKASIIVLQALVLSVLMSAVASATVMKPNVNTRYNLAVGTEYTDTRNFNNLITGDKTFTFTYKFTAKNSAASLSGDFSPNNFTALTAVWQKVNGGAILFQQSLIGLGSGFDFIIASLIGGEKYNLIVTGALNQNGTATKYDLAVSAIPIPPAAVLLLTGLIGIGALGRRRRGAKKVSV